MNLPDLIQFAYAYSYARYKTYRVAMIDYLLNHDQCHIIVRRVPCSDHPTTRSFDLRYTCIKQKH